MKSLKIKMVLFCLVFVFIITGCQDDSTSSTSSEDLKELNVGAVFSMELNAPVWVAMSQGYYEEAGLDMNLSYLAGGSYVRDAVISEDIDLGLMDMHLAVTASATGHPVSIIGDWFEAELWTFMVSKNRLDIQSIGDMEGAVILTSPPGSTAWAIARIVLADEGLDPDRDVSFLAQPDYSPETWLNLLESGDADVAVTWEPHRTLLEDHEVAQNILSIREPEIAQEYLGGEVTASSAVSHDQVIEDRSDVLEGFVEATNRGIKYIQNSSVDEIAEIIAPHMDVDVEFAKTAFSGAIDAYVHDIRISKERYERRVNLFVEEEAIDRYVPFEEGVDTRFAGETD